MEREQGWDLCVYITLTVHYPRGGRGLPHTLLLIQWCLVTKAHSIASVRIFIHPSLSFHFSLNFLSYSTVEMSACIT